MSEVREDDMRNVRKEATKQTPGMKCSNGMEWNTAVEWNGTQLKLTESQYTLVSLQEN